MSTGFFLPPMLETQPKQGQWRQASGVEFTLCMRLLQYCLLQLRVWHILQLHLHALHFMTTCSPWLRILSTCMLDSCDWTNTALWSTPQQFMMCVPVRSSPYRLLSEALSANQISASGAAGANSSIAALILLLLLHLPGMMLITRRRSSRTQTCSPFSSGQSLLTG